MSLFLYHRIAILNNTLYTVWTKYTYTDIHIAIETCHEIMNKYCYINCTTEVVANTKVENKTIRNKLDVDPQRDDDASPMSLYRCMLRPT